MNATSIQTFLGRMGLVERLIDGLEHFYRRELGIAGRIALHEPLFAGNEWTYVKEALDSNWVSSAGPFVDRFERLCAQHSGAAYAVATVNGTSALHSALLAIGVLPGDVVLCPAVSFVATANAIAYCGAEPLFLDVEPEHLTIDAMRLREFLRDECAVSGDTVYYRRDGRRIAGVIAVHVFGHPADMTQITQVASDAKLTVVEDAAESIGSYYHGSPCGAFGSVGVLSFNGNKTVTAGGGGAVLTNDSALAERVRHLTTTAKTSQGFEIDHDMVGYNYRMPNLNAALACAQLEQIPVFLRAKRALANRYLAMFGRRFVAEAADVTTNYWLNSILLDTDADRDSFLSNTERAGIETRACWKPLPELRMYRHCPVARGGIAVAQDRCARIVNLPSSVTLGSQLLTRQLDD